MILDPVTNLLSDVVFMLEKMNWPSPLVVARSLDLLVISGPVAAINLNPPPSIQIPDTFHGFKRAFTLAHETAHALLEWRGIDAELLAYYAPECAYSNLEALANHIAGLIMMPPPMHDKVLRRFGFGPQALVHLAGEVDAPLPVTMDRVVYDTDSYRRAALLFKRGYVTKFSTTTWLDVEAYDHIPDPVERFPGIQLLTLGEGMVLGTWGE